MPRGGARPGAGKPPVPPGFREFCRDIANSDEIRQLLEAEARRNPEFALKVAEHGYGRPPQALDVKVGGGDAPIEFRCHFADGSPLGEGLPAAALPVPEGDAP